MDADGNYFLSQSQVAEAIGVHSSLILRFLESEQLKALLGKGFRFDKIDTESDGGWGGRRQVKIIPVNIASAFWLHQSIKGNNRAQSLMYACTVESLERRHGRRFSEVKRISVSALSGYLPS